MITRLIKRAARVAGIDVTRHRPDFVDLMRRHDITTVLDVGANEGQYARELRELGFQGRILSFEPIGDVFTELEKNAQLDKDWDVFQCALGQEEGELDIRVSVKSVFSSFKDLSQYSKDNFGGAATSRTERVMVHRLDQFVSREQLDLSRTYLKIDTQGFEQEVLIGAGDTLEHICAVQAELALQPLYEGQEPWFNTISWMAERGFRTVLAKENGIDQARCELLELDVVFLNEAMRTAVATTTTSKRKRLAAGQGPSVRTIKKNGGRTRART